MHEAIAIRGVVAVLILLAFIAYSGKLESLRSKRMGLLIVRGLVLMMAYTTYYLAFPVDGACQHCGDSGSRCRCS